MIKVDTDSFVPIFEQIKQGIKRDITSGVLKPQQALSSIRDLAADLIVNPNTVARAYRELEMEGFIETRQGRGSLVAGNSAALAKQEREAILDRIFNEAVAEARRFYLNDAEILRLFERKLRAGGGNVATGEPKVKGDKHE
jgi:GntR family transcriptional regulator